MRFLIVYFAVALGLVFQPGQAGAEESPLSEIRLQARFIRASSPAFTRLDQLPKGPLVVPQTWEVTDWMGYKKVPKTLVSQRGVETVLVVADDIDLSGGDYSWTRGNSAKHVILIADVIRLENDFRLDLSSPGVSDKHAGSLTIVARKLVAGKNAKLHITAQGERGLNIPARTETYNRQVPHPGPYRGRLGGGAIKPKMINKTFTRVTPGRVEPGGLGGDVTVVLQEIDSPLGIQTAQDLSKLTTTWNGHVALKLNGGLKKPDGQQTVHGMDNLPAAEKWLPKNALAEWYARLLHHAVTEMQFLALQRPKGYRMALLNWMLRMDGIAVYKPAFSQPGYLASLRTLKDIKKELFPQLWEADPIQVVLDGKVHTLNPLAEGLTNSWWLPPTEVLMKPWISPEGPRMGLLIVQPGPQLSLKLFMDLELRIDPRLERAFREKLEEIGAQYQGQFTGWELIPEDVQLPGVSQLKVRALNDTIRCELTLEGNNQTVAKLLVKLVSREGLPLKLHWVYEKDDQYKGQPFQVNASFSRRVDAGVALYGNTVRNVSSESLAVEYVETPDGIEVLNPSIRIAPGQSEKLPVRVNSIPPTGVVFQPPNHEELLKRFLIAKSHLVDEIRIVNQLADTPKRRLKSVEFRVTYGSGPSAIQTGTYRLKPANGGFTEMSLQFPRLGQELLLQVKGRAIYEDGSEPFQAKFLSRQVFLNKALFQ